MRVHRSFIVSLDKITSMTKSSVHIGKTLITVGDQYRDAFSQFVGKWI
jgi:DNA-binding LytR/AlgR family response regulator